MAASEGERPGFMQRVRGETNSVHGARLGGLALCVALAAGGARAEGPVDLTSAVARAFEGIEACVALRDIAAGAGAAVSDERTCRKRLPPCATFELAATVIALDRGVVPDANAPVKRNPPYEGDPPSGVSLRDAFRRPVPWVYEEIARRIGAGTFDKSLAAMRYGNAEAVGPVERIGAGENADGLSLSPPEQVEFIARLKRGELPTSSDSQSRAIEIVPIEKIGDVSVGWKTGVCDSSGWVIGWVDRPERGSVAFAAAAQGQGQDAGDLLARTRKLLNELALTPAR